VTKLNVRVKPGSKRPGIFLLDGNVTLRVRERAVEGAANQACIRALSQALGVSSSQIELISGARGSEKRFTVTGLDEPAVRERLGAASSCEV
jgi:uncharacterized protein YggU (UPF0235/DUF167 family)